MSREDGMVAIVYSGQIQNRFLLQATILVQNTASRIKHGLGGFDLLGLF
jgi:hypothetical protein